MVCTTLIVFCIVYALLAISNGSESTATVIFSSSAPSRGLSYYPHPECASLPYRTLSGRCTSAVDPSVGQAPSVQSSYFNVSSTSFKDDDLPSTRFISNLFADQKGKATSSIDVNEMFTFFGQFIDHDLVDTPVNKQEPIAIDVPDNDQHIKSATLPFFRSVRDSHNTYRIVERPITTATSALDLSQVYGTNEERNKFLRIGNSCRLKISRDNLLPLNTGNFSNIPNNSDDFFITGISRANETPMLTAMHTIWVREHNNICEMLESKPELGVSDPEELYEWARLMCIAEYQKIIYEEYLPAILGSPLKKYEGYDPSVDLTVSIEFSTAAFRLGHALVGDFISLKNSDGKDMDPIPLQDMFFSPSDKFSSTLMNDIIRRAISTKAQELNANVANSLRNFLFENMPGSLGLDLLAINLQRARDHNIPSFNEIREFFLEEKVLNFSDISVRAAESLKVAYGHVDKVEAWIGLMAEDGPESTLIGPTLDAIIRREFERLRNGDQFFYLRDGQIPQNLQAAFPQFESLLREGFLFNRILLQATGVESQYINREVNGFKM